MIADYIKVSWLMMRSKPVRSALSLLGIYIGVLALVIILAIREGVRRQLDELFQTSGSRIIFIHPGFDPVSKRIGSLSLDDVQWMRSQPNVLSVLPRLTQDADVRTVATTVHAHLIGVDAPFIPLYRIPMWRGRNFLNEEMVGQQPVCILTRQTAHDLFPSSPALGAIVDIDGTLTTVIGIVDWTDAIAQRTSSSDVDVLIPYPWTLMQENLFISMVEIRMPATLSVDDAIRSVKSGISRGEPTRENLYFVRSIEQIIQQGRRSNDKLMASLLGIAAISLLVGGIGVANVMVTSVTERTREVGIRKALGATRRAILIQFMVEAAVLSGCGGLLAVLTGLLAVRVAPVFFTVPFPLAAAFAPTLLCLLTTVLIGLIAGVYPASRAASLSPAEALRYE